MVRVVHEGEWRIEKFGLHERARFVRIDVWRQSFARELVVQVETVLDSWLAIDLRIAR